MRQDEDGQALAEFGLIAPLLLMMLAGIVYCGGLVITQERLAMGARSAARRLAMNASEHMLTTGDARPGSVQQAVAEALPGMRGVRGTGISWGSVSLGEGQAVDATSATYVKRGSLKIGGKSYQCGVGCMLYGVKVQKDLAQDLSPFGRMITVLGGKLAGVASLGAVAVMPGDLPPKGSEASVMGLNTWITKIVNEKEPR